LLVPGHSWEDFNLIAGESKLRGRPRQRGGDLQLHKREPPTCGVLVGRRTRCAFREFFVENLRGVLAIAGRGQIASGGKFAYGEGKGVAEKKGEVLPEVRGQKEERRGLSGSFRKVLPTEGQVSIAQKKGAKPIPKVKWNGGGVSS